MTSAPPLISAPAESSPDLPRPNTATFLPAKTVMGIMLCRPGRAGALSQLQRREARKRQHHRDNPEADDDLRLGPAELLVVVMDRRHPEHALAGQLERHDLHDHRHRLEPEKAANDGEHDLVLDR